MTLTSSDRKKPMNGWQRLWVVFCVATAACVASVVSMTWPREADLLEDRAVYAVELALKASAAKAKSAGNERDELTLLRALEAGPRTMRLETYGDLSAEQILERIQSSLAGTQELQLLDARRSRDQATLDTKRRDYLTAGVVAWLAASALTYAFGWSVAWVRRGFNRTDEASQETPHK